MSLYIFAGYGDLSVSVVLTNGGPALKSGDRSRCLGQGTCPGFFPTQMPVWVWLVVVMVLGAFCSRGIHHPVHPDVTVNVLIYICLGLRLISWWEGLAAMLDMGSLCILRDWQAPIPMPC